MSRLGKFRAVLVIGVLLALLAVVSARAAMIDGEELVDPTAPLFLAAPVGNIEDVDDLFATFSSYEVNSILIRPNLKVAVVNSKRVGIGDTVGNAEVVNIEPGKVVLNIDGEEKTIELYERSIKTLREGEQ